jgi:hypothetical protein
MGWGGVISRRPLDPGSQGGDDELLMQRLAAVVRISSDRTPTGFRRRRSSGLLFQIRRRVGRAGPLGSFMPPVYSPD